MITKQDFLKQVKEQIYPLIDKEKDAKVFRTCLTGSFFIFLTLLCLLVFLHVTYPAQTKENLNDRILGFLIGPFCVSVLVAGISWKAYMRYTKKKLRPAVFKILNAAYVSEKEIPGLSAKQLQKLYFLPHFYGRNIDNVQHDNLGMLNEKVPFYIQELSFSRGWFNPETFQGPLVRFFLPKKPDLSLMALKKESLLSRDLTALSSKENLDNLLKSKGWQQLSLKNAKLNKEYFIFTNNQILARRILTPSFMEHIQRLEDVYEAPINFMFNEEQLILTIKTDQDMFEFFTEARMIQTYARFYDEVEALHQFQKFLESK